MKNFWNDFKAFISKGNILDMAVGVIIATAFGKIITSLVDDVVMPLIGKLIGGVDFSTWAIPLGQPVGGGEPITLNIGVFINAIINFLLVALIIFLVLRAIVKAQEKAKALAGKKEEEEEEEEAAPTQEELLTEIRDLLKAKQDADDQ